MPAITVDAATDAEREPDAATAAEKSAVTLNYEAMLAALNDLLAEIREERRQAEASSNIVDAQRGQEQATTQPPTYGSKRTPHSPGYNPKGCPPEWREWPDARSATYTFSRWIVRACNRFREGAPRSMIEVPHYFDGEAVAWVSASTVVFGRIR